MTGTAPLKGRPTDGRVGRGLRVAVSAGRRFNACVGRRFTRAGSFPRCAAVILIGFVAIQPFTRANAQSGNDLFQQALSKERAEGKLDEAIRLYERVVREFASDHALAAKALLQLGACYEKLGNAEARGAYERLLRDFADQRDMVASARARLSALSRGAQPGAPAGLTMRRIYDGPGLDWCNGLSSDARYLSHPDWFTGNIAVADLRTATVRRVTTNGSISLVTAQSGEFGECSVFSPDDRQLAYYWRARDGGAELRTIRLDGSQQRTVYRQPVERLKEGYVQPLDWSPDGRQILTLLYLENGSRQLASIGAGDGGVRVLKRIDAGDVGAAFSPDGRSVAYSMRTSADSLKHDVFVVASDGTRDAVVVRHPADDLFVGWAPDGGSLFFASDRTGSFGIWTVAIDNGQPRGAPRLVKADIGAIAPVRLLNGTFYYALHSRMSEVHIAPIDPQSGRPLAAPVPAKADFSGSNDSPDWSPDGSSIAYRSLRGAADVFAPPALISILNVKSGEERQVRPALESMEPFGEGPRWSPDGRSLLVIARQQTPQHGVYQVDARTGATTLLVKAAPGQYLLHAIWGRDGRSIFYTIGGPTRIVRRDLASRTDTELVMLGIPAGVPKLALSPDGQSLAFSSLEPAAKPRATINIVPAAGGVPRTIYRGPEDERLSVFAWAPDGRHIWFGKQTGGDPASSRPIAQETWRITPDGRTSERIALDSRGAIGGLHLSPDGRQLALTIGEAKSELWALENLAAPSPRAPVAAAARPAPKR